MAVKAANFAKKIRLEKKYFRSYNSDDRISARFHQERRVLKCLLSILAILKFDWKFYFCWCLVCCPLLRFSTSSNVLHFNESLLGLELKCFPASVPLSFNYLTTFVYYEILRFKKFMLTRTLFQNSLQV